MTIEWTPIKPPKFKFKKQPIPRCPTPQEEIIGLLEEWYKAIGQPVPPEDLEACSRIDAEIAESNRKELEASKISEKPAYGTPEFWKDYWAKKRAAVNHAPKK